MQCTMEFMNRLEDGQLGIMSDEDFRDEAKVIRALNLTMSQSVLSLPDKFHFAHIVLLYHWGKSHDTVVRMALNLVSDAMRSYLLPMRYQQSSKTSRHIASHYLKLEDKVLVNTCLPTLDQLAHQLFSCIQFNDCHQPWLYTASDIHQQICDLMKIFIDYDERYLIKFGECSVMNNNTNIVNVLTLHRKALEKLLLGTTESAGAVTVESEALSEEHKIPSGFQQVVELVIFHINAIAGLGSVICKLCQSFDNQLFLNSNGICQELYTIVDTFMAVSKKVIGEMSDCNDLVHNTTKICLKDVLDAVFAISQNGKNKIFIGELGISLLLLAVIEHNHNDKKLLLVACQCMRFIANEKIATEKVKIGAAGGCAILTNVLKQHKDDLEISMEISALIWDIADYWKNKIDFSEVGAYETLFVLLKLYKERSEVLEPVLGALSAIAVNKDDQYFLKECGVCDLVVEILQRNMQCDTVSCGVIQQSCGLIWSLSLHEDNHYNFHEIHTLELLWEAIQLFNKNIPVLEQALGAMTALNRNNDVLSLSIHWKFAFVGDQKDVLVELLMLNATYGDILEKICFIIKQLALVEDFKHIFANRTFIFDVLSDCMEFHITNGRLLKILEDLRSQFIVY